MTVDLRWLAFLLPFVLPIAIAVMSISVLAITGAEITPEISQALAEISAYFGVFGGFLLVVIIFAIRRPIYRKLW